MVRHSGGSEPHLCAVDCKVSAKHIFFFMLSVMEMAKILIGTHYKVWRKKATRLYSSVFSELLIQV